MNYTIRGESFSGLPSPGDQQTSPAVAGQLIATICVAGWACGMSAKYPKGTAAHGHDANLKQLRIEASGHKVSGYRDATILKFCRVRRTAESGHKFEVYVATLLA